MFEHLKKFSNIVISGPQRSGTRIAAKIIASDTGKNYIDERYISFHDFRLLQYYLQKGRVVVQCPGLCHLLHNIKRENTLIIMVRRSIEEIISSEYRVWEKDSERIELLKYGYTDGIISKIKYSFWDSEQRAILGRRAKEINFNDLESHHLFIKERKDFRWDQTE